MAGGLFALPKMYKITQNSLLKKHGIFCLTFSNLRQKIRFFVSQSKSAATWLSPYMGMLFFLSSSAVTPSPAVRVPEKLPS